VTDPDQLIVLAARLAADRVAARKTRNGLDAEWPLEREQLGQEMKRGLSELGVAADDVGLEAIPITQGWDPPPGNLDVTVRHADGKRLWLAAELKLENINETLWDVFRLTTASTADGAEAGYLVIAAYESTWDKSECRILFPPDDEAWAIPSQVLISKCHHAYRGLLATPDNKGRIREVPLWIELKTLEPGYKLAHYPHLELRVTRVKPMSSERVRFTTLHWPEGVDPESGELDQGLEDRLRSDRERSAP
jgi:hypothetical protein